MKLLVPVKGPVAVFPMAVRLPRGLGKDMTLHHGICDYVGVGD